ncbi:MAG TPA: hypothetical protein VMV56_02095 [Williamwhitmania sp.]|nr:hypothetical protein [Williamwhitmania sp.]
MKLGLLNREEVFNFVEFNITGNSDIYFKCDSESKFLNIDIFNIFAGCFERSNHLYDFYGATKFNSRNLIPLINELKENMNHIKAINSLEEMREYLSSIFMGKNLFEELERRDKNWKARWRAYVRKLIQISQSLISLCELCVTEERTMWVINF